MYFVNKVFMSCRFQAIFALMHVLLLQIRPSRLSHLSRKRMPLSLGLYCVLTSSTFIQTARETVVHYQVPQGQRKQIKSIVSKRHESHWTRVSRGVCGRLRADSSVRESVRKSLCQRRRLTLGRPKFYSGHRTKHEVPLPQKLKRIRK